MNEGRGMGYERGMENGSAAKMRMPYPYVPPYIARENEYQTGARNRRMGDDEEEMEMGGDNIIPMESVRRNKMIGFGDGAGMYRGQPRTETGRYKRRSEMTMHSGKEDAQQVAFGGTVSMSSAAKGQKLTRGMAEEWVDMMENEDETHPRGGKYSMDQAKQLAQSIGMSTAGQKLIDFYAILNAMYSDYHKVAKKHGVDKPEYYADLAKAFIEDVDAVPNKTMMYYKCIVNHE